MKHKSACILIAVCLILSACSSSKKINASSYELPASSLKPYGRFLMNANGLELISSAVHFGFNFSGKTCTIYASINNANGHNYLQYELDGVYQNHRIKINGGAVQQIVIGVKTAGIHTVTIYKATEAATGPIFIEKITGNNLYSITPSDAPLIEFIGNSITCGAAADTSEYKCGEGEYHDHHNAYYAYGPRVARALNANYILSSVSGIGIYRTWNMDNPSMPQVYEKARLTTEDTTLWNF